MAPSKLHSTLEMSLFSQLPLVSRRMVCLRDRGGATTLLIDLELHLCFAASQPARSMALDL